MFYIWIVTIVQLPLHVMKQLNMPYFRSSDIKSYDYELWHIRLFTNVIMLSAKLFPVVPRSAVIIHPVQSCSFELHNKAVLGFVFQWKPCRPFCEGADGGPRFQPSPFAFKDGIIRPDPKSSFMKFCNRNYLCCLIVTYRMEYRRRYCLHDIMFIFI